MLIGIDRDIEALNVAKERLKEFNNINSVLSYFCLSNIPFTSKSISLYHCYYTELNLHKKIRQSL